MDDPLLRPHFAEATQGCLQRGPKKTSGRRIFFLTGLCALVENPFAYIDLAPLMKRRQRRFWVLRV